MFDDFESNADETFSQEDAFQILHDLEQNTSEELRKKRSHFRVEVKAAVTVRPGNSSEILSYKVQGVTGDISESGLGALLPIPIRVGDVFRMEFDTTKLPLPLTFARCVRCRLIREDAFDAGFIFFAPIGLPANLSAGQPGRD